MGGWVGRGELQYCLDLEQRRGGGINSFTVGGVEGVGWEGGVLDSYFSFPLGKTSHSLFLQLLSGFSGKQYLNLSLDGKKSALKT